MVAKDGASNIVYVGDDKGNIHERRIGDEDGEDELDDDMEGNGHQTKKAKI
ncbi:hypothetical protein PtrEW13061_011199 [Pyrenophora tritici-repentis]|nr:hypothetical protein PtrEW13061_011199 [Pyrenophora tritici-repentis]